MDPHFVQIQAAIRDALVNPAMSSELDRICADAVKDLGCADNAERRNFFRHLLRNLRLREQMRYLEGAKEADAVLGTTDHSHEAAHAVFNAIMGALGEANPASNANGDPRRAALGPHGTG